MTALAAYRRLFSNRALARLFAGEFVSSVGDWLYLVALLIVVYERSASAALLGLVGAARVLPYVVLSVPAGIVADRFERRLVLLITDLARGLLMVGLAWLVAVDGPLVAIIALALLAACFSAFFGPTIGAYIPQLVADETELGPANSTWASLDNLAFILGPAAAGLLIAAGGLAPAFLLNAVSFGVVAVVLWWLPSGGAAMDRAGRPEATAADAPQSAPPAPVGGARLPLRPLAGLTLLDSGDRFVSGGLGVLTVVLATQVLGAGEAATGYLNAAIGVGGLIGALASGALVLRADFGLPLVGGGLVFGLGLAALGVAPGLAVALVAMAVAAAGSLVMEVMATTLFQRMIPDRLRGRALGGLETIGTLSNAGGALVLPLAAEQFGAAPVLVGGAVLMAVCVVIAAILARPVLRRGSAMAATLDRMAGLSVFAGVPLVRLEAAARRLVELAVEPGEAVVRQGEPADRFYVIVLGDYLVTRVEPGQDEAEAIRRMGPDEVFGEIGLLRGSPRTATVTAVSPGHLLALEGPDFLELVGSGPELVGRMLDLHRGAVARSS
ncbi:MAG: MFS transporter [Candidatus Limnocylindrales bacterium]